MPKSSAISIGLRSRTLATIAERISHSHPVLTVAGATLIQHHCGTCGDRDATGFFCSALLAHMSRPIPHRSSQFSRPAFFYRSFFWALLQANSCVRQLRGFCFPGSALHTIGFPPRMQPLALEAAALAFGCPSKMGQKKETFSCPTYMLSGIALGVVARQRRSLGPTASLRIRPSPPSYSLTFMSLGLPARRQERGFYMPGYFPKKRRAMSMVSHTPWATMGMARLRRYRR